MRLLAGTVMHARSRPARNGFEYPVWYVEVDAAQVDRAREIAGIAIDRFGAASLQRRDHGPRDGTALRPWFDRQVARFGITPVERVSLVAMPRILGLAFNPVGFWFGWRGDALQAVIAEVNNTFGERHAYVVARADREPIAPGEVIEARKVFHVSPFFDLEGRYRFAFDWRDGRMDIRIDLVHGGETRLRTGLRLAAEPLTRNALRRALWRWPMQGISVMARIHWQALRLWRKRVPFHHKPAPPIEEVTQ